MRYLMLFGVLLMMLAAAPGAQGDGCYIPRLDAASARASYSADISEPEQKAAIAYLEGQERLILQVSYKGKASEFVWLVPTPSKPTVVKCDFPVFHTLHQATLPRVKYWFDVDIRMHDLLRARGSKSAKSPSSVEVMEQKSLGFYDVAVLRAGKSADLISWLKTNGYMVKPAMEPVLSDYINRGWVFTAAKIRPGESVCEGQLDALQFDFRSSKPIYPLKISSLNPGRTKLLLYVLSEHRVDASALKTVLVGSEFDRNRMFNPYRCESVFNWDGKRYDFHAPPYMTKLTGNLSAKQMQDDIILRRSRTDDIVEPTVPAPFWENFGSVVAFALTAILLPPWSLVTVAVCLGTGFTRWGRRKQKTWFGLAILVFLSPMVVMLLAGAWQMTYILAGALIIRFIISAMHRNNAASPKS